MYATRYNPSTGQPHEKRLPDGTEPTFGYQDVLDGIKKVALAVPAPVSCGVARDSSSHVIHRYHGYDFALF